MLVIEWRQWSLVLTRKWYQYCTSTHWPLLLSLRFLFLLCIIKDSWDLSEVIGISVVYLCS